MRTLLIRLMLFSIFLLLVLFTVIGMMGRYGPKSFRKNIKDKRGDIGHMFTRNKELNSLDSIDILVIGSSHVYRGFDPRFFSKKGIRLFNLGSSAQTPLQTEILIKKHIHRLRPKLVIFEVFPGVFANDGVESSVDLLANCPIDLSSVIMAFRINNLITYNALLFHGFRKLFFNDNFEEQVCKSGECYIPGGFVQRKEIEVFKGEKKSKTRTWNFRDDQKAAFKRTLSFLKNENYSTILIQSPISRVMYDSYQNNTGIDSFYRSFGFPYFNMNVSKIGSYNGYYYDRDHLNIKGVRQFNKLVLYVLRDACGWKEKAKVN